MLFQLKKSSQTLSSARRGGNRWAGFNRYQGAILASLIAILIVVTRLLTIPLLPVDETRYLSVAWEMYQSGEWLVPHINGLPYSHKPPLMFWLINLSWHLFGVSSEAAMVLMPLFGIATFWLLSGLSNRLAPDRPDIATWAPLILVSFSLWQLHQSMTMFDMMNAAFVLLAVHCWLTALTKSGQAGVYYTGVALGLGMLAKGPVILIYWLPMALFLSYNLHGERTHRQCTLRMMYALLISCIVILSWAIPAALSGGPEFAKAIFWEQSAGRVYNSFAHERPWYWYLVLLPIFILPWSLVWRWRFDTLPSTTLLSRCAIVGTFPTWFLFSLISGKQPHYLLPTMPYLALLFANVLQQWRGGREWGYIVVLGLVSVILLFSPELIPHFFSGCELGRWARILSLLPLTMAYWLYRWPTTLALIVSWPMTVVCLLVAISPVLQRNYDMTPMAQTIASLQQQGKEVAFVDRYQNQFTYLGRLSRPLTIVPSRELEQWFEQHPEGIAVMVMRRPSSIWLSGAMFTQPFGDRTLLMLNRDAWLQGQGSESQK